VKDHVEFLERRRDLLRSEVKDSHAIEAILLSQGKQHEYERQRQLTLDAEAELMEAESELHRVAGEYGDNARLSSTRGGHRSHENLYSGN
jgi:hypothetical protein